MTPTRAIVLCAGQGQRLRPFTDAVPKCLVPVRGRPILEWTLRALRIAGIDDVRLVTGWRDETLVPWGLPTRRNERFESTNMVASLLTAGEWLDGRVIVVYGDIVTHPDTFRVVTTSLQDDVVVPVNSAWLALWQERMSDPLADAETLRVDRNGCLREIGKKPRTLDDVQGQFMGVVGFPGSMMSALRARFDLERLVDRRTGADISRMWMTDLVQQLVDEGHCVRAPSVEGGWFEIDTSDDLAATSSTASVVEAAFSWWPAEGPG